MGKLLVSCRAFVLGCQSWQLPPAQPPWAEGLGRQGAPAGESRVLEEGPCSPITLLKPQVGHRQQRGGCSDTQRELQAGSRRAG